MRNRLARIEVEYAQARKAMFEEGAASGKSEVASAASYWEFGRGSTRRSFLAALDGDRPDVIENGLESACRGVRHTNGIAFDRKSLYRPFSCRERR